MSYKDEVLNAFDHLHDASWPVISKDFWHTANTLDTCIDLIVQGTRTWGDDPEFRKQCRKILEMIKTSKIFFDKVYPGQNGPDKRSPDVWWDDYGWWGITFTKIFQHFADIVKVAGPGPLPVTKSDCLKIAHDSWTALGSYSQWVNNVLLGPNELRRLPKRCPVYVGSFGGSWNHTPDLDHRESGGIQNTVTNGLFLVLSAWLYQNTKDSNFLNATADQYLWFRNWYMNYLQNQAECPLPGNQQGLFRCLSKTDKSKLLVVYERARDPKNATYNQGEPAFFDGQLWAGDQGLLLGGLAAVLDSKQAIGALPIIKQQDPEFPGTAMGIALSVLSGVSWLFDGTEVLHEAPLNKPLGTTFAADMATGKGVLMRYLDYAASKTGLSVASKIEACAKAVLASTDPLAFRWNTSTDTKIGTDEPTVEEYQKVKPDKRFEPSAYSAGFDALNAAIPYLGT